MRRTAVIDLGSNSFRLVVYDWEPGGPWTLSDEIREAVRISAGMGDESVLQPDAIERAVLDRGGVRLVLPGARGSTTSSRSGPARSATRTTATSCST